ncbi:MAG: hypothetical protein ACRDVL_12465 [Acidimicrobiia bacterium]
MFGFILRKIRNLFLLAVGAAIAAKLLLESHAEPETEDIDLVAIFEGRHLISTADPFFGGKVLVAFGGALIDLREATPSPTGILVDLAVFMGGVSVVVPEGWRVKWEGSIYAGGFSDETRTTAAPDVPVVILKGFVIMGGLQATTRNPAEMRSR